MFLNRRVIDEQAQQRDQERENELDRLSNLSSIQRTIEKGLEKTLQFAKKYGEYETIKNGYYVEPFEIPDCFNGEFPVQISNELHKSGYEVVKITKDGVPPTFAIIAR